MTLRVAWLIGAIALGAQLFAAKPLAAQELPTHRLTGGVGVPVPLSIHGKYPEPSDTSVGFIGHAVLGYDAGPVRKVRWLRFGGQFSVVHMAGSVGDASGRVTFLTLNPTIGVFLAPIPSLDDWFLGLGGGPGVLRNTVYVDEDLNKSAHSLGARGYASVTWRPMPRLGVMIRAALDVYGEPFDEPTWYNQPLGDTNFISYALGVSYAW